MCETLAEIAVSRFNTGFRRCEEHLREAIQPERVSLDCFA
jgi:hypothetical protein